MKKTFKRIVASLLVAVMLFGSASLETLTGIDFSSLFGVEAAAKDGDVLFTSVAADGYENAIFPMEYVNISYSEDKHTKIHNGRYRYANDLAGKDINRDDFFAPFTLEIADLDWDPGANGIVFKSKDKVHYADGRLHYMYIMVGHDDNIDYLKNLEKEGKEGKIIIPQGTAFYQEGKKGKATGNHVHMEIFSENAFADKSKRTEISKKTRVRIRDAFFITPEQERNMKGQIKDGWKKTNDIGDNRDPYVSEMRKNNQLTNATATVLSDASGANSKGIYSTPYHIKTETPISVKKGDKVSISGWIMNKYGNRWWRVKYDDKEGWMYDKWITTPKEAPLKADINFYVGYKSASSYKQRLDTLDGYEKFNQTTTSKNDGISVRGTINSPGRKIKEIKAMITVSTDKAGPVQSVCSKTVQPNSETYTLGSEALDKAMTFKSLKPGTYKFVLTAEIEKSKLPGDHQVFYVLEESTFTVYDENTNKETKDALKRKAIQIMGNFVISAIDGLKNLKQEKKEKDLVNPPVIEPKTTPDSSNTGSGSGGSSGSGSGSGSTSAPAAKVYYPGHYRVTASLNVRTGPGSSYAKATSAIPKGTEIGITEVSSNGWGKTGYNGVTGWVSLNYCTYIKAFASIQKPETVAVKYNSDRDFAAGSIVNASWDAVNYADAYNAYLKKSDGTVVKAQTDIRGTSTYFTVDEAGTYYITVAATNSQYVGDESAPTATFTAHAPCTVTFLDWNGRTETRTVKYGEAATAPITPTREGYIFKGWKQPFDHVTSDITVEAEYQIIEYSVKFVREIKNSETGKTEQQIISNQKVKYGSAATPPADVEAPNELYVFAGWNNEEYKCVKSSLTVKAVFQWKNATLPVGITNITATRVKGGYEIQLKISCSDASYRVGRVIVSLKTAEGKQVVTTESAAFSLPSDTQLKNMDELFVPAEEPATVAEIYVVESFGNSIPISEVKTTSINMNDEWSGWTFDKWPDNTYDDSETRTLYSYKTKSTTTANTKNLPGWTNYNTTTSSLNGSTYDYVGEVNTDGHVRRVTTTTEPVYSTWYRYAHYTNGGYNVNTGKKATWVCSPWYGNNDDKCGPTNIGPHYYESASPLAYQMSTTWGDRRKYYANCPHTVSNTIYGCQQCLNTWFYSETAFQKQTGSKTKYDYTDTYYTYYFEKWSDWSAWTATVNTASDTKQVKTALQYRYKMNGLGIEDNSGVARVASTVYAGLGENDILLPNLKEFARKAVVLYIYKYNEASDWTGEYIGQQTIDPDGNYSFNFKLREEPTAETGDYIVSIGVEGCSDTMTIGKIVAPKPEYKVVFKYRSDPADNASEYIILDEQIVKEGDAAVAPEHVEFEGYRFNGWLTDLSYITEDTMFVEYGSEEDEKIITFEADYEPEEYVVVFVDWDNDSLVMKRYEYGENIVAPIIKTAEGYQALWEGLNMENPVVTGDTVITAKHTKKTYEVNFYNYDGEIIDTQTVEYGSTASDVAIDKKDNYIFVDWKYTEDLFENSIVEGDTIYAGEPVVNFYPVFVFDESVEDPVSSLENGTYAEAQTVELTTETEGAVIYYTLDGTDPKTAVNDVDQAAKVFEYTGPITLSRSVTLKYYACAFEKNDSEVMTNYYAINAGQSESEWMLHEDIPGYVTENEGEYEIESAEGYRYKDIFVSSNYSDIASYEAQGWKKNGFEYGEWSDWFMAEPDLTGLAYESETRQPEPELEIRYQYTHYKYLDSSGAYAYSPTAVSGTECELETIQLETKLPTAGYLSGTTTKYYTYNGEKWFNYQLAEVEVVPDYTMFRYRLKEYALEKWSAWTTEAPVEGETRESESATVYKYLIPEMCLVKIDPQYSDFGAETLYEIVEVNEYLTVDEAEYTYEGYDFLGFYTDSEFTTYFNHKTTPVSGAMTLYPKYKVHEFTVIFVDYDGTVILEETVEYGQCAGAFGAELERKGYVFIGWDYENLNFITEDVIATAQYVDEDEYCTVSLNYGKYNMMAGNSVKLIATVTPEDTENPNLIWYSTDEAVVTVSDEGFVTAVGEGEASIVVETESTGMIDECVITVSSNPSETLCLTYSSGLTLDRENALLRGVTNSVWTASAIKKEFMNEEEDMQIADINGNVLADDALVGTGSVIKFMNGEKVLDEIYIVITGDMNGDGYVNNRDAAMITRYLVEKEKANFCQMVAIDVNGDGFVNNRDASMVSRYLVGKETL